eukprot:2139143-Rhodomonas_salina.1
MSTPADCTPAPLGTCEDLFEELLKRLVAFSGPGKTRKTDFGLGLASYTPRTLNKALKRLLLFLHQPFNPIDFGTTTYTLSNDRAIKQFVQKRFTYEITRADICYDIVILCHARVFEVLVKVKRDVDFTEDGLWQVKMDLFHVETALVEDQVDTKLMYHMLTDVHNRSTCILNELLDDNATALAESKTLEDRQKAENGKALCQQLQSSLNTANSYFCEQQHAGEAVEESITRLLDVYDNVLLQTDKARVYAMKFC